MIRLLLIALLWLLPLPALAVTPVVGDLSNYRIDIDSGFNGTRIFLFGARHDNGDIVIVVRGPSKDFIVRKKERMGGVWINSDRMKFFSVPDFYAIGSSRPLADIAKANVFTQLGIGEDHLLNAPTEFETSSSFADFKDALLRYQHKRRLFVAEASPVAFMGETLFKTVVEFPDNIPAGKYTAEIYLMSDGEVVGMQATPITVVKSGLDAFLHMYAHDHPLLYGISAVVIALCAGWFAGRIFEKI